MTNYTKAFLSAVIFFTVISFAVKAQTNVSGGIYSNTTWTKANSPYIVTDTIVVFPGDTLTIEPGVTVEFDNNMLLEIRQAVLIAIGTSIDSITFTSSSISPFPGIWDNVYLNGGGMTSSFSYCNVHYSSNGLDGDGSTYILNSTFTNNITGLSGGTLIDSCVFENNTFGIGAFSYGIISNSIFSNNQTGISAGGVITHIINCTINSNQTGVEGNDGIYIDNSIIDSNSIAGISFTSDLDSVVNCQIKYNGVGYLNLNNVSYTWDNNIITRNIIENNNIGIKTNNWADNIFCNKICSNSTYDFYFNVQGNNTVISNNYWCSNDSATIRSYIYDGYDNINLGLVSFMPIDTVGCYLTGCDIHLSATVTNATCDTCHNGQATAVVSNSTGNIIYTWYTSPLQSTQTATGLAAGTYTVCVTDANGCSACNYSVFVDSTNCNGFSITANATNASCTACADGRISINIMNGTPPYTYNWIPFGSGQGIDSTLTTGLYQICVADLYGCVACDTATVGIGACSAYFDLYPDTIAHQYTAVNNAFGAGTLTYVWSWGDGRANDSTAYPSHTYAVAGFYTICLTITDTAGCTNTYCNSFYLLRTTNTMIHVTVVPPVVTGVNEVSSNATMYIFPNPASDYFTLFVPENNINGRLRIYSLFGELIYTSTISKQETNIDVSALAKGIYVLEVSYGDNISRNKFIRE